MALIYDLLGQDNYLYNEKHLYDQNPAFSSESPANYQDFKNLSRRFSEDSYFYLKTMPDNVKHYSNLTKALTIKKSNTYCDLSILKDDK